MLHTWYILLQCVPYCIRMF